MFRTLLPPALSLCLAVAPFSAVLAQTIIAEAPAPADWGKAKLSGIDIAIPPGWSEVERRDDAITFFGGDVAKRTGPGFTLMLESDPTKMLKEGGFQDQGEVIYDNGALFRRYSVEAKPEAEITISGEFLVSSLPMVNGEFLMAGALGYNVDINDYRATFDTIFAALGVPAPGEGVMQTALNGAFGYLLPEGWETGSYDEDEALTLSQEGGQGKVRLMRHAVEGAGSHRSGWYQPSATVGVPVMFLGQPALSYEWHGPSKYYNDGRDSDEITRLFIFESCLGNGDTASIEVTGMPDFHVSAQVMRLLDEMVFAPDGAAGAACRAIDLPQGAPLGTSTLGRAEASGFTLWISPYAAGDGWRNERFGTASFSLPESWGGGPVEGGISIWMSSRGEHQIALSHSPDAPVLAAKRAELRLPDGTRFFRYSVPDGTLLISAAPIGPEGHLRIEATGGTIEGAAFADILGTFTLAMAEPAAGQIQSDALLDGLVTIAPPAGFEVIATTDSVTLKALDGRGFLTLAKGAAVLPPAGLIGQIPQGRLASYASSHGHDWTEYGWPGTTPTFSDGGTPDKGWYFLNILRECLPNGEPVAFAWGGISRFTGGDSLAAARAAFAFDWPEGMAACDPINDAANAFPPQSKKPEPKTVEVAPQTETASPSGLALSSAEQGSEGDWIGQVPLAALPSPATESLAGRWQGGRFANGSAAKIDLNGAESIGADAQPAINSAVVPIAPPPVPLQTPPPDADHDRFTPIEAGYSIYQNDRYGTFISYPSGYFLPEPPPDSGDGRHFTSVDGTARFYVYAQFNALGQSQSEQIAQDKSDPAHDIVSYERAGPGWYVLSGTNGAEIYYRRVIEDTNGLIQVFEITYPISRKADFDPVVSYMAKSFGPGSDLVTTQPATQAQPATEATQSPGAGLPAVNLGALHTPERGTAERTAIIDAARPGAAEQIGRHVIFVISVFRTDGTWAFLQGRPVNPDGSPLNWSTTPFAAEIKKGVMSDVYMALLVKRGGKWLLLDAAFGPTDVAWYDWVAAYNLPEALFTPP